MISSVIALMVAGLAAASDGSAATQQTTAATAQPSAASAPAAKEPSEKIVCRQMVPTGSRLGGQRVCKSASEWSEINHNASTMVTDAQMNGMRSGIPNH